MIHFFKSKNHNIDTSKFKNLLHDTVIKDFEREMCSYVGAKYSCTVNSATSSIFLIFLNKNIEISIPSMIPPVVINSLITSGNTIKFYDDTEWVGDSYILHRFPDFKIVDSAQKVEKDQFKKECNPGDLMIFSHYPTKPVGSCDGGTIVSDDYEKIEKIRELSMNGMSFSENNWEREIKFPGYKMYMNSIQAEIALRNLKDLEENNRKIILIKDYYNSEFGISNKSNHLYRINVKDNSKFIDQMRKEEIICGVHYRPQHDNKIYLEYSKQPGNRSFKNSEKIGKTTVSLPFYPDLSEKEQDLIIKKVKKYLHE